MNGERTVSDRAVSLNASQPSGVGEICVFWPRRENEQGRRRCESETGNMLTVADIIIYLPCITLSPLLLFPGLALHST